MRGIFLSLPFRRSGTLLATMFIVTLTPSQTVEAQASVALGNGVSAAAAARGGTMVAAQGSPLDALEGNPAGLATLRFRSLDLGGVGVLAYGSFRNSVDPHGRMSGLAGALPYAAAGAPLGATKWRVGLALTPDLLMRATWHYIDPPGTAGASYGLQKNESEIVALRAAAALARSLGPHWTAGVTLGLDDNTNTLIAPYIFQQQPQLAGLKVLLNLQTHGIGWNGSAGAQWQPRNNLRLGLAWKSGTSIHTHGDATGSASAQFTALGIAADPTFRYQAAVENHLPQSAAGGFFWQAPHRVRLGLEGGWTGWATAFRQLPATLTLGTNQTINTITGSSTLVDAVPLHWRDQGSLHVGVDRPLAEHWTLRAGYSYQSNPVPSATLTPITAAILTSSLAMGAGWKQDHWGWDISYQAQLPSAQAVTHSSLLAGEYDNSHVAVWTESFTVSLHTAF